MPEASDNHCPVLQEHDYIGLSEVSSVKPMASSASDDNNSSSSFEDTDLRLGLGLGLALGSGNSSSITAKPEPKPEPKPTQQMPEFLAVKSSSKRGYTEALAMPDNRFHAETGARKAAAEPEVNAVPKTQSFIPTWTAAKPNVPSWLPANHEKPAATPASFPNKHQEAPERVATEDAPPPPKDRVVGWPPVRSYRRQTLAKPQEMFVKVNMDGITVGRKVDLNAYNSYEGLILALEEMFQPSNGAQGSSQAIPGRDKHFLMPGSSDFVLTYEDKDGDWMLVGDVPWSMFVSTVKRLRIARGSDANGPAPRAQEKSKYHV